VTGEGRHRRCRAGVWRQAFGKMGPEEAAVLDAGNGGAPEGESKRVILTSLPEQDLVGPLPGWPALEPVDRVLTVSTGKPRRVEGPREWARMSRPALQLHLCRGAMSSTWAPRLSGDE
jgi:hypothetical protein